MCGIVGAVARRDVTGILLEGLRHLEYRGYDSAGLSLLSSPDQPIITVRTVGKVRQLAAAASEAAVRGRTGIAHTRWATHGKPSIANAHPHQSGQQIAIVHNGIIENVAQWKEELGKAGYDFTSETDSELIAHLIHWARNTDGMSLLGAVQTTVGKLLGAWGLCVIDHTESNQIVAARNGSPLVIGLGSGENFIASDPLALGQVTDRFIYLEEGDVARLGPDQVEVWHGASQVRRPETRIGGRDSKADKGGYRHFMLKEIHEQPQAIRNTLHGRIGQGRILEKALGRQAGALFDRVKSVQIVACGTSYHAGQVASYWLESLARLPCQVDIASDYRYRDVTVQPDSLLVTISQSGETADTLAALRHAQTKRYLATLAVCNVASSSLVREADFCLLTRAGREIGVASTKAFTTQLCLLLILSIALARRNGLQPEQEKVLVGQLAGVPELVALALELSESIGQLASELAHRDHCLFLGRGIQYPVVREGALKLKEISYLHAEAYPAGELKHGPLALVDSNMPVIAVAPNDGLLEKLRINLSEVSARGARLYVFADESIQYRSDPNCRVINLPRSPEMLAPIVFVVPLQLLSYHVALAKGTDVDHPRNLAKSVTVE